MKQLSQKQASRCEEAKEPVCKCRCGGALHGAKRGKGAEFFDSLPADDPHHIPSKERKSREREAAIAKRYDLLGELRSRLGPNWEP